MSICDIEESDAATRIYEIGNYHNFSAGYQLD
jgi:hypothetical protein